MSSSAKWNFRDEVTRACPELNLGEDLWKSDMLGKKNYGSFKQTWFTNRADDKVSGSGKCKVKKESIDSIDLLKSKHARCHAPNRFGTVNMEDNVNIKQS